MYKIYCTAPTPEMENMGKELGLKTSVVNNLVSVWQSINNRPNTMPTITQLKELIRNNQKEIEEYNKLITNKISWARTSDNGYEVSTRGDKRFSALVATFNKGTIIDGIDVGGRTIEDVYQSVIKKSRKGQAPAKDSKLYRAPVNSYSGDITPNANTIFVFGSNPEGRHGAGAAKVARDKFGAIYGQGEGLQGHAYALPTKDLRVKENKSLRSISEEQIIESIKKLYDTARQNSDKQFKIAYRNTTTASLNGYTGLEMIDMFLKAGSIPSNIVFSKEWVDTGKFNLSKKALEDFSYTEGYLPLWQEWARQNPQLMDELRIKAQGKTLTDQFANTRVSQARALSDILNSTLGLQISSPNQPPHIEANTSSIRVNKESPRAILAREMSPAEIEDRASMIAHDFSRVVSEHIDDRINELENQIATEEDSIERLNLTRDLIDIKDPKKNRRIMIQDLGIENIINEIKDGYREWTTLDNEEISDLGDPIHIKESYQKILNNFDVLFNESLSELESMELLKIDRNENKIEDDQDTVDDNDQVNGDDTEGNRVNGNEGYTFRIRFLDPGKSARAETKRALSDIRKVTSKFNIDTEDYDIESVDNDLGVATYYREDYCHSVLLGLLNGMDSPDDFSIKDNNGELHFPILERNVGKYPWINQVIEKLKYNPTLTTIFYNDFRKEFISYWVQNSEGKSFPINEPVALDSTLKSVTYNYEQGNLQTSDSVFDTTMNINIDNVNKAISSVNSYLKKGQTIEDYELPEYASNITDLLKTIGFNERNIDLTSLADVNNVENNLDILYEVLRNTKEILNKAKDLKAGEHLINEAKENYTKIAGLVGKVTELDAKTTFRQNGNTYPSYAAPNYIETVFKRILNNDKREQFLEENYKKYKWFYEDGKWKNELLNQLENDENARFECKLKNVFYMSDLDYEDWTPEVIAKGFVNEYFAIPEDSGYDTKYAWYGFPIFSDTQMATFIKLKKYTGDFKSQLIPLYRQLVKQELERINLVKQREKQGVPKIANFDKKGKKFCFLPELNNISDAEGVLFLDRIKELQEQKDLEGINNLIDNAIDQVLTRIYTNFLNNNPSVVDDTMKRIMLNTGVQTEEEVLEKLEEFVWNQVYASSQIVQVLTTDLAYYRDAVDFQKRFKEVYAAGTKLNTNSPYGRKIEKTVYIKDNIITSPTYSSLKELFKRAYKEDRISRLDYDALLNKFKDVNATDGQAYRSLSSYRSIMDMLGNWTDEMEAAFNRITNNEWDISDLNTIWQTIKPFVFSQTSTPDGLGDYMKVPHQNKNSEFLLLATYQTLNSALSRSPQVRALNKFMEDYNIDVVQFESAVKVGGHGIIDINVSPKAIDKALSGSIEIGNKTYSIPDINGLSYSDAFETIKNDYDNKLDNNQITQDEYNNVMEYFIPSEDEVYDILVNNTTKQTKDENGNTRESDVMEKEGGVYYNRSTVHFLDYDDYMIAQPTPEHLFDVEAVYGSQFRNLITSDMPEDMEITVGDKTIKGRDNILKEYQSLIIENLLEDYNKLRGEVSTIEDLQQRLLSIVKGNPKYGRDILNALELVDYNGRKVFNIPLYEPTITSKIQEIVNSMFKNSITKQHIKGAACILVSNFGFTDKLRVNRNEDGSIKEIECYLPAYSKKMYEPFLVEDEDSNGYRIDYSKLKKSDEELLNFIGYRIPTEGKYSMLPLKIVGFLPQQNGSSMMLPAEITTIAGLDYDVDKEFMMLPEFEEKNTYNIKGAWDDFYRDPDNADIVEEISRNISIGAERSELSEEDFMQWLKNEGHRKYELSETAQDRFSKWFKSRKKDYFIRSEFKKIKYDDNKSIQENTRKQRNNRIIDISRAILTSGQLSLDAQSPGNFDGIKKTARVSEIIRNPEYLSEYAREFRLGSINDTIIHLLNNNLNSLNDFLERVREDYNPLTVDTFIRFHQQNMTGGALIGIYANNTTMQAKLQNSGLSIRPQYRFKIDGRKIERLDSIYTSEFINGKTIVKKISKNCSEFSAASVDNVKDPVLASLMQNKKTANITCFMLRAGLSIPEIGAFFDLPIVRGILNYDEAKSLLAEIVGANPKDVRIPAARDVTTEEMLSVAALTPMLDKLDRDVQIKLLEKNIELYNLFSMIKNMSQFLGDTVQSFRADSPNGALGRSIALGKRQTLAIERIINSSRKEKYPLAGVENIINNDIANVDDSIDSLRTKIMNTKVPMLQAFYTLGIDFGTKLLSDYFIQSSQYANNIVDFIEYNSRLPLGAGVIDRIYKSITLFGLTDSTMFGDEKGVSYEAKRKFYIDEFPKMFNNILRNNPDIANLSFIRKLTVNNGKIIMKDSARNSSRLNEMLMNSADNLLYMDNPEAQKLAIQLFSYAFYAEGFDFGPSNFSSLLSSIFKSSFPEYINTLRDMAGNIGTSDRWNRFLDQFYANNPEYAPSVGLDRVTILDEGKIILDLKNVSNTNTVTPVAWNYISHIDGKNGITRLFKYDPESPENTESRCVYRPLKTVKGNLYNINKSLDDMVTEEAKYDTVQVDRTNYTEPQDNNPANHDSDIKEGRTMTLEELIQSSIDEDSFNYIEELENMDMESDLASTLESQLNDFDYEEGLKENNINPCKKG